jgi:hypothetical protein
MGIDERRTQQIITDLVEVDAQGKLLLFFRTASEPGNELLLGD